MVTVIIMSQTGEWVKDFVHNVVPLSYDMDNEK